MLLLQVQCIGNESEAETLNVRSFLYIWDHATFLLDGLIHLVNLHRTNLNGRLVMEMNEPFIFGNTKQEWKKTV